MGLFSKPKPPKVDVAALTNIAETNAGKKRSIVDGLGGQLAPISTNFEQKRNSLGTDYMRDVDNNVARFGMETNNLKTANMVAGDAANAKFKEQAFRDVPEVQKAIREALGGAGTLNTGAARANLAKPIINAVQSSADFTAQNNINNLNNDNRLNEKTVDFGNASRTAALETKFGLDKDTVDYLTSIGRSDLIDKANSMLGIEGQLGDDKMAIEQTRQANEMARAAAKASNRAAVLGSLGQLGGMALGMPFGPMGMAMGSQLGGTAANMATGSPTQIDPTLMFALANRGAPNKTAVVRSLGGRIPVGTGAY